MFWSQWPGSQVLPGQLPLNTNSSGCYAPHAFFPVPWVKDICFCFERRRFPNCVLNVFLFVLFPPFRFLYFFIFWQLVLNYIHSDADFFQRQDLYHSFPRVTEDIERKVRVQVTNKDRKFSKVSMFCCCWNVLSHHVFVLHPSRLSQEQAFCPTGNDWEH